MSDYDDWLAERIRQRELRKSCVSKIRHATLEAATKAVRGHRRKFHESKVPYECKHCGGWHIGGQKL